MNDGCGWTRKPKPTTLADLRYRSMAAVQTLKQRDKDVEEEEPLEEVAKAPMDEGDMGSTMIL